MRSSFPLIAGKRRFSNHRLLALCLLGTIPLAQANDNDFFLRINAGGPDYIDNTGNLWRADEAYNTGRVSSSASVGIGDTDDPELYQSSRWDAEAVPELHYSFDVPDGGYTVSLHFADTWSGTQGVGLRVFDVALEEQPVLTGLDIFAEVGGNAALVKTLTVEVNDGTLDIDFLRQVQNPAIRGIEILAIPPADVLSVQAMDVTDQWQTVSYPDSGVLPVLIAGVPSYTGKDPGVIRLQPVDAAGTSIAFKEWDYLDGVHASEQVSVLTLLPGRHVMPDGSIWDVGSFTLSGTAVWQAQTFSQPFQNTPQIFLTAQTARGAQVVSVRARAVSNNGFLAALFEQESLNDGHATETIGYLAISSPTGSGTVPLQGVDAPYNLQSVQLNQDFKAVGQTRLKLEEERSRDSEVAHTLETVAVLELDGHIFAQDISSLGFDTIALRQEVEIIPEVVDITLEAENYTTISDVDNNNVDDFTQNTRADASGGVYMQSGRINGSFLEYQINLPKDDVYNIAVRGTGTSGSTNSFRVSVDNGAESVVQLNKDDSWSWKTVTDADTGLGPYVLAAGQHVIRVMKREANAKIDQLKISSSTAELVPNVSLSPSSLNFAEQAVGSVSNSQSVTLSNTGAAPLNITRISTTGNFSESNNCSNQLAPTRSCQIEVSFLPASAGNLTGELTIVDDAGNNTTAVSLSGIGNSGAVSEVLFSHNFNDETLHTYTKADLRTKWNNPKTVLKKNAVKIVKDPAPSGSRGNVMQVFHAANSVVHQNDSGSEWYMDIGAHDEMYLAYDVYFEGDAEFVKGGKLPCLISVDYWPHAGIPSDGTDDWSGIVVWKEDGLSSSYFYHANQPNNFGQVKTWKNGPEGQVFFKRGVWSRVEVYYKMNTPGKLDGSAQAWLNGVKVLDINSIMYRMPGGERLKIGQFRFLSAYNNNKKVGPTSDQYIYFDNFVISTKPITH